MEPSGNWTERIQRASARTSATEKPGRSDGGRSAFAGAVVGAAPLDATLPLGRLVWLEPPGAGPAGPPGNGVEIVVGCVERSRPVPPAGGRVGGPAGTPTVGGTADVGALGEGATGGEGRLGTTGLATPWARTRVKEESTTERTDTSHLTQAMPIQRQQAQTA